MNSEAIIDLPTFNTLKDAMGEDFLDELLQAYYDETPQLLQTLQKALMNEDCESFQRAAHSIKSTSNTFGALTYGSQARELEMLGKEKCITGVATKVEALINNFTAVHQALEALFHG